MKSLKEQKKQLLKEKAEILKLRRELLGLRKEKTAILKLKNEVKKLRRSPEVERYRKIGKKALKKTGQGLGKFFAGAYKQMEIATRPEPVKRTRKKTTRKRR